MPKAQSSVSVSYTHLVNACDAGREGELIFKHVYDLSGSKKPVKRLWISSLEDSAILDGMQHLRSAEEYRHPVSYTHLDVYKRQVWNFTIYKSSRQAFFIS